MEKIFNQYLLNTYCRVGPLFVKGKGSYLFDRKGKKFLDFFPGWGVSILGHSHPEIVKIISSQAKKLIHLPNNLYQEEQLKLAKLIIKNSFLGKVFFANSGAEAVETALKISRLYGEGKRFEIITMRNSFHGRTFGALSCTGQEKYKKAFEPLLPGIIEVNFNDFEDLKNKFTLKTVAVILELIQGEGGINVANVDYIKKVRDFCKEHKLLFIIDEVQTGMGRTGKLFCYEHYQIIPDIMLLAKGLGGGFPISAVVVKEDFTSLLRPGLHASTFGGSPLACSVASKVFEVIKEGKILENVKKISKYLLENLIKFKKEFSFIKEVRGKGLMLGLELDRPTYPIFLKALEEKLIINSTHENVIRIMPALNIEKKEVDLALEKLKKVFKKI